MHKCCAVGLCCHSAYLYGQLTACQIHAETLEHNGASFSFIQMICFGQKTPKLLICLPEQGELPSCRYISGLGATLPVIGSLVLKAKIGWSYFLHPN